MVIHFSFWFKIPITKFSSWFDVKYLTKVCVLAYKCCLLSHNLITRLCISFYEVTPLALGRRKEKSDFSLVRVRTQHLTSEAQSWVLTYNYCCFVAYKRDSSIVTPTESLSYLGVIKDWSSMNTFVS